MYLAKVHLNILSHFWIVFSRIPNCFGAVVKELKKKKKIYDTAYLAVSLIL